MRLQVCGANKFQLDLERQSDADVLALRVTTSRAIDLSLRNRWNCFGPRPRPHTRRERERRNAHAQYQLMGMRRRFLWGRVGMLSYYYYGHKVLGGGVRNAPLLRGGYCLPPVMTAFLACHRPAVCDFRPQMAPSPWAAPILICLHSPLAANINFLQVHPPMCEKICRAPRQVLYLLIIFSSYMMI
jgi:hypothetical protein